MLKPNLVLLPVISKHRAVCWHLYQVFCAAYNIDPTGPLPKCIEIGLKLIFKYLKQQFVGFKTVAERCFEKDQYSKVSKKRKRC